MAKIYHLYTGQDREQVVVGLGAAIAAAKQRAYGLTCHSGKTEEVTIKDNTGQYVGTASGHISASYRGMQ